jgi:hypothetical protein
MNPTVVIWILAVAVAVLVGREVGKWLFGASEKLTIKKRAAQKLAGILRENGLRLLPALLEDFAVGDVQDMVEKIHDVCKIVDAGSDAILKELEQTYENVLARKLATPAGLAYIKARFATALKLSPYLKDLFVDTNTVGLKSTGTNVLYMRGSRGDSNLKSIPVSELVLDELDEMDTHAVWLALERLSGQVEKHILAVSTPTVPKYGIHKLYLTSTQEHFYFQCPHCSRWTELLWPDCVEIAGESVNDPRCKESFLKCRECKRKLDHEAKPEFLGCGVWRATEPNVLPEEARGFLALAEVLQRMLDVPEPFQVKLSPGRLADPGLLTVEQAGKRLKLTSRLVYKKCLTGYLQPVRIGRRIYIPVAEVERHEAHR